MSEPFIAEIRIFPFNFAPRGWAFCDGQVLPISQNTALFSLVGTTYGGDGRTTFGLPNLQGRAAMQPRQGPGLTPRDLGEAGGTETVTVAISQIPSHTHALSASNEIGEDRRAVGEALARSTGGPLYAPAGTTPVALAPEALAPAGGGAPHNNLMPYLTLSFCIALQGIFPPRA